MGIAEAHAVGLASGLALGGYKPLVALYSTFLQRAIDQSIINVALCNLPVVFAIDRAGLVGDDGPTHHGMFDMALLRTILICASLLLQMKPNWFMRFIRHSCYLAL